MRAVRCLAHAEPRSAQGACRRGRAADRSASGHRRRRHHRGPASPRTGSTRYPHHGRAGTPGEDLGLRGGDGRRRRAHPRGFRDEMAAFYRVGGPARLRSHGPGDVGRDERDRPSRHDAGEDGRAGRRHIGCALFATYAILSACIGRGRTGEGQYIDASLFDAALAFSTWERTFVTHPFEEWEGLLLVVGIPAGRMGDLPRGVRRRAWPPPVLQRADDDACREGGHSPRPRRPPPG